MAVRLVTYDHAPTAGSSVLPESSALSCAVLILTVRASMQLAAIGVCL